MSCNHKFKPRYSQKYPDWFTDIMTMAKDGLVGKWSADYPAQENIYVCDVCVRCGISTTPPEIGNANSANPVPGGDQI